MLLAASRNSRCNARGLQSLTSVKGVSRIQAVSAIASSSPLASSNVVAQAGSSRGFSTVLARPNGSNASPSSGTKLQSLSAAHLKRSLDTALRSDSRPVAAVIFVRAFSAKRSGARKTLLSKRKDKDKKDKDDEGSKSEDTGKKDDSKPSDKSGNRSEDSSTTTTLVPKAQKRFDPTSLANVIVIGIPKPFFPGFGTVASIPADDPIATQMFQMIKTKPNYVAFFMKKTIEPPKKEGEAKTADAEAKPADSSSSASSSSSSSTTGSSGSGSSNAPATTDNKNAPPRLIGAVQNIEDVHKMGTLVEIHYGQQSGGYVQFIFGAHHRVEIVEPATFQPVLRAAIKHHVDNPSSLSNLTEDEKMSIKAYQLEIRQALAQLNERGIVPRGGDLSALWLFRSQADIDQNPGWLCDYAAEFCRSAEPEQQQKVLSILDIKTRLHETVLLLKKELHILSIKDEINKKTTGMMNEAQKRYVMREKLKVLKKELGDKNDVEPMVQKWRERLAARVVPEEVKKTIEEELTRIEGMESNSLEFSMLRNYLDWLTVLPWGKFTEENFDIERAKEVLNKDHYGMEDVKKRILQFIAVGKLRGQVPQGKIICLVGPPGVGKTSIGKSIARALNRKFYRFSVGGMTDVAEIKGHRRTYVGAMPGKLIQAMKSTECANPVILIDEIDKIGHGGIRGDPTSALLEVLDPEQNSTFLDHYLDVPFDLSKVLFICTANVKDTIPDALRDRMEFIRLSGYVGQEKVHIVKQYLEPLERERAGLKAEDAKLHDPAIENLIRWYCREAGVRSLQRHVNKIFNEIAFKKAVGEAGPFEVTEANLDTFVGKPKFQKERLYDHPPPGVVTGLAWSANGGSTLYIESQVADHFPSPKKKKGKPAADNENQVEIPADEDEEGSGPSSGSLFATGQMGQVMKESTQIAYTLARAILFRVDPKSRFFQQSRIHMHVPEGATPKDGPSAGITMVSSLLSLAMNVPAKRDLAMTGEVTLTGKVLPIGGVKEKTISATRSAVKELIFPAGNKKDWDELPDFVRQGITVHFVESYDEVFRIVFPDAKLPPSPLDASAAKSNVIDVTASSATATPVAALAASSISRVAAPARPNA